MLRARLPNGLMNGISQTLRPAVRPPHPRHLAYMKGPKIVAGAGKAAARVSVLVGGSAAATYSYYSQKAKEWSDELGDRVAGTLAWLRSLLLDYDYHNDKSDQQPIDNDHSPEINDSSFKYSGSDGGGEVFSGITKKLIELRSVLRAVDHDDAIRLPNLVVIGSQSSGKSSVLEAIVGREFLPKGNNMVTRRPIEITLVNTAGGAEYAEFPKQGFGMMKDFTRVQQVISELNDAVTEAEVISEIPIEIRIYSPNVPDLSLVDLPGYIAVSSKNQPPQLKEKIAFLCRKYLSEPNVILAVCAANVDLANSEALNESRKVDPFGTRTFGVLTKMDLVTPERAVELLQNQEYPLRLGYIGVVSKDVHAYMTSEMTPFSSRITPEDAYFSQHTKEFLPVNDRIGIRKLRRLLVTILEENMRASLKSTVEHVRHELEEARYQFKVQYNDRRITAESYVAEVIDDIKNGMRRVSEEFSRPNLRKKLQNVFDDRVVDVTAEVYWHDERFLELNKSSSWSEDQLKYWQAALERAHSLLTKSGIGRVTTQAVVDDLIRAFELITGSPSLQYHEEAKKKICQLAQDIIRTRFHTTVDQVENTIKPYKYEVEFSDQEWKENLKHAIGVLENQVKVAEKKIDDIKSSLGQRKYRSLMSYLNEIEKRKLPENTSKSINSTETRPENVYSPKLIAKGMEAKKLEDQVANLRSRLSYIRPGWFHSSACSENKISNQQETCKALCPEVYLMVISQKLVNASAMFIWIEMLAELFYLFPRELDNRVYYGMNTKEIEAFAKENPRIRDHLTLQNRRDTLELAMDQLLHLYKS